MSRVHSWGVESMDKNKWDIEQPIEKQQYGAVNAGVPQEEWMKPKSDKVVLYHLKKEKLKAYIVGCIILFLIVIGGTIGVLQMQTVSFEQLSGLKYDIGKYVVGDVTFRTKMVKTEFGLRRGVDRKLKKWKYYVGLQYGENNKYILMLVDKEYYEKLKSLPEINPSEVGKDQPQRGKGVSIVGKVISTDTIPKYYVYWREVVGIKENELEDSKGNLLPDYEEKDEELLSKKMTIIEYIKPMDVLKEKIWIVCGVAGIYLLIAAIFFWRIRFDFFEIEETI